MRLWIHPMIVPIRLIFSLIWLSVHWEGVLKLLVPWGDTSKQRDPFWPFLGWKRVPLSPEQSGFKSWFPPPKTHFVLPCNRPRVWMCINLCVALQKQWQRWNDKEEGQPRLWEDTDVEVSGHGGFTGRQQSEALFHSKNVNFSERTPGIKSDRACLQGFFFTYFNIFTRDMGLFMCCGTFSLWVSIAQIRTNYNLKCFFDPAINSCLYSMLQVNVRIWVCDTRGMYSDLLNVCVYYLGLRSRHGQLLRKYPPDNNRK